MPSRSDSLQQQAPHNDRVDNTLEMPAPDVKAISARIEKNLYKKLKYYSFEKERKLNEIIETALRNYIDNIEKK